MPNENWDGVWNSGQKEEGDAIMEVPRKCLRSHSSNLKHVYAYVLQLCGFLPAGEVEGGKGEGFATKLRASSEYSMQRDDYNYWTLQWEVWGWYAVHLVSMVTPIYLYIFAAV